jgi:hypothetical protein
MAKLKRTGKGPIRSGHARGLFALVALVIVCLGAGTGTASARGLSTGFIDDVYLSPNAATRDRWLARSQQEDAGILRLNVSWRAIATSKPKAPRSAADPAYAFGSLDAGILDAASRGFSVMLTVYNAPKWAEGAHRPGNVDPGTWKPSPSAFGNFGHALASRYSGHFANSSGVTLPRVRYFEAWNEPNLNLYLTPQWHGKKPASPQIYRGLLNAFYSGVHSGQHGAKVIAGATAPVGGPPGDATSMGPVTFLQNLFCLGKRCKHFHKPKLNVLSAHPITTAGGGRSGNPHEHAAFKRDLFLADFHRVGGILHAAERRHRVSGGGHHPLWATEMWWATNPPSAFGVSYAKQARWLPLALYLLWKQDARVAINFKIKDTRGFGSGLFTTNGKAKPSARTFRFPFVVHSAKKHSAAVWGKAPQAGRLAIQRKKNGKWRTLKAFSVKRGGVFTARVGVRPSAKLRAKIGHSASAASSASTTAAKASRLESPSLPTPAVLAPYVETAR